MYKLLIPMVGTLTKRSIHFSDYCYYKSAKIAAFHIPTPMSSWAAASAPEIGGTMISSSHVYRICCTHMFPSSPSYWCHPPSLHLCRGWDGSSQSQQESREESHTTVTISSETAGGSAGCTLDSTGVQGRKHIFYRAPPVAWDSHGHHAFPLILVLPSEVGALDTIAQMLKLRMREMS